MLTDHVDFAGLRHHGDVEAQPGLLDFAVNVQGAAPPRWLRDRLVSALDSLGRYPAAADERHARETVAARHGVAPDHVLTLAGGAEGFALLPRLEPRLAAVVHPSFTEPEFALREAGIPVHRVLLEPPYALDPTLVPEEADLVVIGNPTNPTSVLHPAEVVRALLRPGRIVVVDEAFMDAVPGEPESLAAEAGEGLLVLRSLTKTWALAGLRCGYLLGAPEVLGRLVRGRAHWPVGTLQLTAIAATASPRALAETAARAAEIGEHRMAMVAQLTGAGVAVRSPAEAPFLLLEVERGEILREYLRRHGIAVRRGDTFPGLGPGHMRVAVRPPADVDRLVEAFGNAGRLV
ncbi:Rv2231c family pyridoxal phosphate-dependent protein CobC [Nocardia jinanensis]|uniref:Aminotransferase n=1 Tax=Nocardia jinanensis TaxID=382504 RepID=A0A917RH75_9NOCA|nr:Rv2231c family pyridoxal phosphate-dependent protein CobC [Nocardia jinanensis]GGL06088.1 aminotransferase [Nocardia jinanensis]